MQCRPACQPGRIAWPVRLYSATQPRPSDRPFPSSSRCMAPDNTPVLEAEGRDSKPAAEAPRKLKFVVTGGHPGDPEYGCGGTIARLTALGHEVVLLYMNDGAWKEISAPVRIAEAKKACEILKARPAYANQINGHAIVDNEHYRAFQNII